MKEWLRHNVQPLDKVQEYMEKTATMRATLLKERKRPLAEILDEFPRLFDVPGMVSTDRD